MQLWHITFVSLIVIDADENYDKKQKLHLLPIGNNMLILIEQLGGFGKKNLDVTLNSTAKEAAILNIHASFN